MQHGVGCSNLHFLKFGLAKQVLVFLRIKMEHFYHYRFLHAGFNRIFIHFLQLVYLSTGITSPGLYRVIASIISLKGFSSTYCFHTKICCSALIA